MLKCGHFHVSNLIYVNKWSQICSLLNKATQRGKQAIFNPQMYKNRQHPTEAECRLFCCPILPSSCRFCSFLKLLSYRHTANSRRFFCILDSLCQKRKNGRDGDFRRPSHILHEHDCKPGSVFDSHLSTRRVAAVLQPPRERSGQPIAPIPVLLRIEFTASDTLEPTGALLPHLSILTWDTCIP